jgi:hypothetical protein
MFPSPVKVSTEFDEEKMLLMEKHVSETVKDLMDKTRAFREVLLPQWIRIYKGTPREKEKTFPWPGASNLIPQVAATHADELLSRVMAIYQDDPLFVAKIVGDFNDGAGEDQRAAIERFMGDIALEPDELDLYRVEQTWFNSAIKYGTAIVNFPWEYVTEQQLTYVSGASQEGLKNNYKEIVIRDGPHPENLPLNSFLIDPECASLSNSKFMAKIVSFTKMQMEEKAGREEVYDKKIIENLISAGPDRYQAKEVQQEQERSKQMNITGRNTGKWDFVECWYSWRYNNHNFRIVSLYHHGSDLFVGHLFNPYPENIEPFEDAKLAYDDETYYGYGFMEMLESYQNEIATTHNQRIDNRNLANTGMFRINKNSKLASVLQMYPGVLVPADEGEFEAVNKISLSQQITTEDEQLTLGLAKDRSGVDPAIGGAGGGIVNSKRGIYSASGTSVVMQQQNNRNNLRMSDMRSAHVRLGRKVLKMYAYFGLGDKLKKYGDDAETLKDALISYKSGMLGLLIKPATASVNKELEKQNDILLSSTMQRLFQGNLQLIQTMLNQGAPPEIKEYCMKQLEAMNALTKHLLRNFGHADTDRLIPMPEFLAQMKEKRKAMLSGNGPGQNNPATPPQLGPVQGNVPVGGGGAPSIVPNGTPQDRNGPAGVSE